MSTPPAPWFCDLHRVITSRDCPKCEAEQIADLQPDLASHVVMFSGGLGSWLTAKRVVERYGAERVTLLFADVASGRSPHAAEDEDTYRFIQEAAVDVGAQLVTVQDGRDIWQVFRDDRFLGNTRLANCSKFLKQKPCREWLEENADPVNTTVYVGIDWTETHRLPAIAAGWAPYRVEAPMTEWPYLDRDQMVAECEKAGIALPRLYRAGFQHNNCGGFCVRAGQAQMELLLREHPERYAFHETEEQNLRDYLNKDVAVLRDRSTPKNWVPRGICEHGTPVADCRIEECIGEPPPNAVTPLTLRRFRERLEAQPELFDPLDYGGCGCFVGGEAP